MKKNKIIPVLISSIFLTSCGSNTVKVEDYMHDLTYHDNFRILQLSDLHLSSWDDIDQDLTYVQKLKEDAVSNGGVDLMVVSGDLFTFASKNTIDYSLQKLDSLNVPWTIVFGNHDEQLYAEVDYISKKMESMEHALYKNTNDNMTGLSNNIINLKEDGKIVFQVYAIDSNTYTYKGGIGYDYVHEDQIEWYKQGVEYASKNFYGDSWKVGDAAVPSVIFQHIPLVEFQEAYDNKEYDRTGENKESCSPSKYNSGFFKVIQEYKSTKGMYVGHDHVNNSDVTYKDGIHLVYGAKSTDNLYHDEMGYCLVTVNKDGTVKSEHVYKTYEELGVK